MFRITAKMGLLADMSGERRTRSRRKLIPSLPYSPEKVASGISRRRAAMSSSLTRRRRPLPRPWKGMAVRAGQVALDGNGNIVGDGFFEKQCAQVYENIGNALKAAGGDWKNVVQFMSFLTRKEDLPRFAAFRRQEFPKFYPDGVYPPNTLLVVSALASDEILLEVQAIAAI